MATTVTFKTPNGGMLAKCYKTSASAKKAIQALTKKAGFRAISISNPLNSERVRSRQRNISKKY